MIALLLTTLVRRCISTQALCCIREVYLSPLLGSSLLEQAGMLWAFVEVAATGVRNRVRSFDLHSKRSLSLSSTWPSSTKPRKPSEMLLKDVSR